MATARLSANPAPSTDQRNTIDPDATVVGTISEELRELARRPDLPPVPAAKLSAQGSTLGEDAQRTAVGTPEPHRESATFAIPGAGRNQPPGTVAKEEEDLEKTTVYRPEPTCESSTFPIVRETHSPTPEARVIIDQLALSLSVDDSITERLPRGPAYVEARSQEAPSEEGPTILVHAEADPPPGGFLSGFGLGILAGALAALLALLASARV